MSIKLLLSFITLLLSFTASCQNKSDQTQKDDRFNFIINFEPSFSKHGTLTFQSMQSGLVRGELKIFKDEQNSKIESCERVDVSEDRMFSILGFLKTYKFKIKGSIDTISSKRVFWRGDSTTAYKISHGNDGITVNGSLLQNGVTKRFAFWSPKKDSENYQLIQKIFALSNGSFKKKKSLSYLK